MSLFFAIAMMVIAVILVGKSFIVLGVVCLCTAGACFIASDICHAIIERDKADKAAATGKDEEKPTFKESIEAMRAMNDILDKIDKMEKSDD